MVAGTAICRGEIRESTEEAENVTERSQNCGMRSHDQVLRISEQQLGLVLVGDADAAGLTRSARRHSLATGRLEHVTARVLRVRGSPPSERQRVLAAVLDVSPLAYAGGPTAAALWGLPGYRLTPPHVVRPEGVSRRRTELGRVYELAGLGPQHVTALDQIPVVRPEVLVLQLCRSEHPARAERALDNLWRRRLVSGLSLRRTLDSLAASGRDGVSVMRELLKKRGDDYVPPASNLERRFEEVLERAGEPPLLRQVDCGGDHWVGRVDFKDWYLPLVVEVQSERYHSALVDREHDTARLAALRGAGFEVVEVTDEQVWHRPDEVVEAVRAARRRLSSDFPPGNGRPNGHF